MQKKTQRALTAGSSLIILSIFGFGILAIYRHPYEVQTYLDKYWSVSSPNTEHIEIDRSQLCPLVLDSGTIICLPPGWALTSTSLPSESPQWNYQFRSQSARNLLFIIDGERSLTKRPISEYLSTMDGRYGNLLRTEKLYINQQEWSMAIFQNAYISQFFDENTYTYHSYIYNATELKNTDRSNFEQLIRDSLSGINNVASEDSSHSNIDLQVLDINLPQITVEQSLDDSNIYQQLYYINDREVMYTYINTGRDESSATTKAILQYPFAESIDDLQLTATITTVALTPAGDVYKGSIELTQEMMTDIRDQQRVIPGLEATNSN